MIKFYIYEHSLLDENDKKDIIKDFENDGFKYCNKLKDAEYIFVFGGDGTFLKALKEYVNLDIKIVLFNVGRLGFLSSIDEEIGLNEQESYSSFDYLLIKTNNNEYVCINEISITTDRLSTINSFINHQEFKTLMTNQINVVNNLGSTGINRSNLKPLLFPWNHQYIVDIRNEPIYHYYQPLLQPLILTHNDNVEFKFNNNDACSLKIDNQTLNVQNINNINIKQLHSKCRVLNLCNPKSFFKKINKIKNKRLLFYRINSLVF